MRRGSATSLRRSVKTIAVRPFHAPVRRDTLTRRGRSFLFLNWRYSIFNWNDSDEKMSRTRELAAEIGIDKLVWEITNHPPVAASKKYQSATPAWREIYHEIWDTSQTCNAIDGKRLLAAISFENEGAWHGRSTDPTMLTVRVENTGGALWRCAAAGWRRTVRLGAQLHDGNHNMIDLDYACAFLPHDQAGAEAVDIDIELPALETPGDYTLKFDMACQGIDWFEPVGSPVAWGDFTVASAADPTSRLLTGARTSADD